MGKDSGNPTGRWLGVLRPVFWWLLLMLVLFGIRTHQRLMEQTRLNFIVTLNGQQVEATWVLDGQTITSGQNISLGDHKLVVSSPKTEPFTTNFFAWYGPHNFGEIKLKRCVGTLNVQANPPASTITITGPEFSTTLSNSIGTNISVPTDSYTVSAQYPHWSQSQNVTVYYNQAAPCNFAPQLGAVHLTSNKDGATYLLQSTDQTFTGNLPAMLTDLPVENYQLTATYHRRQIKKPVTVEAGATNEMPVQFVLGALRLESSPTGATVTTTNGSYLGQTPFNLLDVPPQTAQLNLSLSGYEAVPITVEVAADQTNSYRTNLVNIRYVSDMQDARAAFTEHHSRHHVAYDLRGMELAVSLLAFLRQRGFHVVSTDHVLEGLSLHLHRQCRQRLGEHIQFRFFPELGFLQIFRLAGPGGKRTGRKADEGVEHTADVVAMEEPPEDLAKVIGFRSLGAHRR